MFLALVRMAGVNGFADRIQDLVVKPRMAENVGELSANYNRHFDDAADNYQNASFAWPWSLLRPEESRALVSVSSNIANIEFLD